MTIDPASLLKLLQGAVIPTLRIILLVYLGLTGYLYFNQTRMIYFPTLDVDRTPKSLGLAFESVRLQASDGTNLSGWFVPASGDRTILFCHGNGGNISDRLSNIGIFHRLGISTFVFDYRGYGNSDGTPTEAGTYLDAEAAWKYLTEERHIPSDHIVVYGESLGGAVASYLAKEKQPGGLILASTFTTVVDRAAELYPFLPIRLLSKYSYNSLERMPAIKVPVLVMHSPQDEVIPFHHGQKLYAAANEPKFFVELKGDHNSGFLDSEEVYRQGIAQFVNRS